MGGWLFAWNYRKALTINNNSNSNSLTDYQVLTTLDTQSLISSGKMRSDCGDIRFTDSDGQTQLNYWIESGCNTSSTKIWVKVPSIPASSTKTIYVYYGNPSATSQSNVDATFVFFDDFISSIDTNKWNLWGYPTPYLYSSSIVKVNGDGSYHSGMTTRQIFNLSNIMFEVKEKNWPVSYNGRPRGWGVSSRNNYSTTDWSSTFVNFYEWCDYQTNCRKFNAPSYTNNFGVADEQYHISSIGIINRTNVRFFFDGNYIGSFSGDLGYDNGYFELWAHDPDSYADWVRVRKYTFPEPTTSVGAEEFGMLFFLLFE
jgi:hypothetical protein